MIPNKYSEFRDTLTMKVPYANWPKALKAVWYEAKGDWESSHNIAQDMHTSRVVVSRLLKQLENENKIKLRRNKIDVLA